jgi:hypothetical protein
MLLDIEKSNVLREELTFGCICRVHPNYYDVTEEVKKKHASEFDQSKTG